jgi:Stage II sporulation protein
MPRRVSAAAAITLLLIGCAGADGLDEHLGTTAEPLTAQCQANVRGVGLRDVETDYLPNVVHCENGGAPFEALKAQAIAARTYLYFKLETSGSIADGQSDQVYSCGSAPTAQQKQAVLDTAGIVLRYKQTTIAAFYVAGGAASAPACEGASASTEPYVTYNQGLSGGALHQTTLGWVSPTNNRNRECLSQLGSRCLANAGKTDDEILHFYYGADIALEQATGSCVPAAPKPPPPKSTDAGSTPDEDPSNDPAQAPGTDNSAAPGETADEGDGTTAGGPRGRRTYDDDVVGCAVSPRPNAGGASVVFPVGVGVALATALLRARRRARRTSL